MNILIIGDIYAALGMACLEEKLPAIKEKYKLDIIIANVENVSQGHSITEVDLNRLLKLGVKVLTSGNHIFDRNETHKLLTDHPNLIRPYNYPNVVSGQGYYIFEVNQKRICVSNVMGTVFMRPQLNNAFLAFEELLTKIANEKIDLHFCDFHAEATSEKIAFGLHFDGRVNVIYGTHTHVPTADLRLLPQKTLFISDIGMTGAYQSIIGADPVSIIKMFTTNLPAKIIPATSGPSMFCAVFCEFNVQNDLIRQEQIILR